MHNITQVQEWPSSSKVNEINAIDIGGELSRVETDYLAK
jgi:hypothetical protein